MSVARLPLIAAVMLAAAVRAQDKPPAKPAEKPAEKPTVKVIAEPIKVEVTLKGVFESSAMTEVAVKPEAWPMFAVLTAVEAGTPVKQGDTLVTFDTEKIDRAIRDLESEQQLADLQIKQAEGELPVSEKAAPLELAAAERGAARAEEDLKRFTETERPFNERAVEFEVKSYRDYLEYAREELKQLQKMYRKDHLTEDTEEIILKRSRNQVEQYEFMLKMGELQRDIALKIQLPRQAADLDERLKRSAITLERARNASGLGLSQRRLALEKGRYERAKAAEKLTHLKHDRDLMTLKSPADGVVYYGRCVNGSWGGALLVAPRLHRGGQIQPDEVVMTVVKPKSLFGRVNVDEKDVRTVTVGTAARVMSAADPLVKLPAVVDAVSPVPLGPGTFEARLKLDGADVAAVAGMSCVAKVVAYRKESALTLPAASVFAEDADDELFYVYVPKEGGAPEKRTVTVGKRVGAKVEVTGGVKAGDAVLKEKP